jgi:nucleoside phosphorylase
MGSGQGDVRVGIVTALPVECAAVRLLVDDMVHQPAPGDPNHYLSGWLPSKESGRPHRVVVALQTQDGTRNAAAICTDLTRSFPNVRCVIMCGIAGGVPAPTAPERHVRLGDIIVGTRGVVDYDHIHSINGANRLRRSVDGLSRALLRGDRELEAKELVGCWPWRVWLDGRGRQLPPGFARPSERTDVLLQHGRRIDHPRRERSGHIPGWPKVHRCAIASSDRLVRDAVMRDEIADRHNVRAVEMEASGVAVGADLHATGWFVIRGVADYCDSAGENDVWHRYASLAAGAYLRSLLAECSPFAGERGHGRNSPATIPVNRNDLGNLAKIVDVLLSVPQMRDDYQRRAIMALLPEHIRTTVPDNVNGRLHVVALVQTCFTVVDGRESLLDALRLSLPPQSLDLQRASAVINAHWPDLGAHSA